MPKLVPHDFTALRGPDFYLEYPKTWTKSDGPAPFRESCPAGCRTRFYLNATHEKAQGGAGWAEIDIARGPYAPPKPKGVKDCAFARLKGFQDYVREYDLKGCDPESCAPCGPRKRPRPPVEGGGGRFLSEMTLPLGNGRLFEEADPDASIRHVVLLYDVAGSIDAIHRVEMWVPRADYQARFMSQFKHLLDSFQSRRQ